MSAEDKFFINHMKALESLGMDISKYPALKRLEKRASKITENACNYSELYPGQVDKLLSTVKRNVAKLFADETLPEGFFINQDPRGYALKIDNEVRDIPEGMSRDWGGYGILAPEEI